MSAAPAAVEAAVPPQNLEAEESVLGAMLLSATAVGTVSELLSAADFYRDRHATIYRAMLGLWAKGEPVAAITLSDELDERSELEFVGGRAQQVYDGATFRRWRQVLVSGPRAAAQLRASGVALVHVPPLGATIAILPIVFAGSLATTAAAYWLTLKDGRVTAVDEQYRP